MEIENRDLCDINDVGPYTCSQHVALSVKIARCSGNDQSASSISVAADQRGCVAAGAFARVARLLTPSSCQVRIRGIRYRDAPPSRDATLARWRALATLRPSEGAAKNLGLATHLFRDATFGR